MKETKNDESLDERIIYYSENQTDIAVGRSSCKDQSRMARKDNLLFNNSHLSKHHAQFSYVYGDMLLKDCGSTFGTTINDKYIFKDRWYTLLPDDVVGFIISRPSSSIAKIVSQFDGDYDIPLEEFSNPSIGIKLRFRAESGKLAFNVVDEGKGSTYVPSKVAKDSDGNYVSDDDDFYDKTNVQTPEPAVRATSYIMKNDPLGDDNEETKIMAGMEENGNEPNGLNDSLLDSHSDSMTGQFKEFNDLPSDLAVAKDQAIDNGSFDLSIVSESESEFGSESDLDSCLHSGSEDGSVVDNYVVIHTTEVDPYEEDESGDENEDEAELIDEGIFGSFSDSDGDDACSQDVSSDNCATLFDNVSELCDCSDSSLDGKQRKRSIGDLDDDSDDESVVHHDLKKIKLTPIDDESPVKQFFKEAGKGAIYVLATITALGIYGSTLENNG